MIENSKEENDDFELSDLPWNENTMGNRDETRRKIFGRLKKSTYRNTLVRNMARKLSIAAAVLVLLVPSVYFIWQNSSTPSPSNPEYAGNLLENAVIPGGDKARLILGDGSVLVLEKEKNGTISREGSVLINKNERQLIYRGAEDISKEDVVYNVISTPRGGQFQVVLPDGSHVWLNAASSLRFPTAFTGEERRVELRGEGYFEIAPDKKKPFTVITDNMEIEVLGTHFNVKAYKDEKDVQTTLLEGAVKINTKNDQVLLEPGQEALLTKNAGNIDIRNVDPEAAVAWKNGYFQFDNEHLYSIMRKVSRWYDVEIIYEADFTDKNFTGTISRYKEVTDVLNMLELTGVIQFQMEGRRIIVMP